MLETLYHWVITYSLMKWIIFNKSVWNLLPGVVSMSLHHTSGHTHTSLECGIPQLSNGVAHNGIDPVIMANLTVIV